MAAAASPSWRIVCEELAAAGCPLLLLVVSPAIAATIIAKHGTTDQRKRFLPGHRRRHPEDRLRHHRAGGGVELPPPRHGRPPRRRRLGAQRPQVLHLRRGRGAVTCWSSARTEDAATGKLKPALFVVPTDAPGLTRSKLDMEIVSPENQLLLYLDDVRLPADALVGRHRTPGCRRSSPASTRSGSRSPPWAPAPPGTPRAGLGLHRHPLGLGRADRLPPGRRAPAGPRADPGRAGPADDRQGGGALRRRPGPGGRGRGEHGQVRLRRRPPRSPSTPPSRCTAATA